MQLKLACGFIYTSPPALLGSTYLGFASQVLPRPTNPDVLSLNVSKLIKSQKLVQQGAVIGYIHSPARKC